MDMYIFFVAKACFPNLMGITGAWKYLFALIKSQEGVCQGQVSNTGMKMLKWQFRPQAQAFLSLTMLTLDFDWFMVFNATFNNITVI